MSAAKRLRTCSEHAATSGLRYVDFMVDAENRTRRGERQVRCVECGLWQWPLAAPEEGQTDGATSDLGEG